jgi:glycosyltransferase involved in cell wall biosynthesis
MVCYNAASTINSALQSVKSQKNVDIELIVIDGGSSDGTANIVRDFGDPIKYFVSEQDNGIYDAMNKGAARATGDVLAFLNADDFYADETVLSLVEAQFLSTQSTVVAGTVEQIDQLGQIKRLIRASNYPKNGFRWGFMLPHPSTFVKLSLFHEIGKFTTQYRIAGDFDFFIRLCNNNKFQLTTLDKTIVKMRIGGVSTAGLGTYKLIGSEMKQALIQNGYSTGHWRIDLRAFRKFTELISTH